MGKTILVYGFPSNVSTNEIKAFLEKYTGEGTVEAVEIKQPKNGVSMTHAKVQFTSLGLAEVIISLSRKIWYGRNYLVAREMDLDIIPMPRTFLHSMDQITLHFGCQMSEERFSVLWKAINVSMKFGSALRKFYFFLSCGSVEYKLELSYENIWQIQLQRPRDQITKFLLIQLLGAPNIYEKEKEKDVPVLSHFKETSDDQWVREIDFTPSCSIGQSSALCLELPYDIQLPNFRENFAYYKENDGKFILESGSSFSANLHLVPILGPPRGFNLPFKILFKINTLVQNGCLSGPTLDAKFFRLVDPQRINISFIEHALEKLYHFKECCYEPVTWLTEQYITYGSKQVVVTPLISLDTGLVYVRRVQITPCKVYFCGPEVNVSNRVLRNYPEDTDNFLRVSFLDENLEKIHSTVLSPRTSNEGRQTGVYRRILSILQNGIVIGDKKFDFLAFSSSQLRDNSAWMFASRPGLTASGIRKWMGEFRQIRNVAKYAARLGQSFGSSKETLKVAKHEIEIIPDIEIHRGGATYVFSDGIGKISAELAHRVAKKCGCKSSTPSAFQIRYGGYKGVVAVDPTSSRKLSLRKSMSKYESENTNLDVLAWSKYQPCFLNRQLITLLSTLGVGDYVFERMQREVVDQLDTILKDPLRAQGALELMSPGDNTNILKEMLLCGYKPDAEPFLSMMMQTFRGAKLLELRTKTRIFVPNGRSMMGCLDETRTLEYGEVFVQISDTRGRQSFGDSLKFCGRGSHQHNSILEGKVVVAKNPCLHPGDVRVLRAVDVHALHHMVDCVVFPQKGKRPHPNECSGSDLDGDIYFVCWDHDLIPPRQINPMDYTPAPTKVLDHDVTIEEVEEYFTNYILNDSLGLIANAHTVFADKASDKALCAPCKELAKLFSIAVDFPKTGVPAEIPRNLRVKVYPDFMEKADKPTYESQSVIGKLFREVKDIAPDKCDIRSFTRDVARRSYDPDMKVDGFEDYVTDAFYYKSEYDYKLGNLMDYYGIKTESEILSGSIMKMSKSFDKRKDADTIGLAVRSLRKEARTWFNNMGIETDADADDVYAIASAWYHVTYHPDYWGCYNEGMDRDHFLSFPWCVYDKLIHIKKDKMSKKRSLHLSSLERRFSHELHLG